MTGELLGGRNGEGLGNVSGRISTCGPLGTECTLSTLHDSSTPQKHEVMDLVHLQKSGKPANSLQPSIHFF